MHKPLLGFELLCVYMCVLSHVLFVSPALAGEFFTTSTTCKAHCVYMCMYIYVCVCAC